MLSLCLENRISLSESDILWIWFGNYRLCARYEKFGFGWKKKLVDESFLNLESEQGFRSLDFESHLSFMDMIWKFTVICKYVKIGFSWKQNLVSFMNPSTLKVNKVSKANDCLSLYFDEMIS